MRNTGVISVGIKLPIVKENDDLETIVVNEVLNATLSSSKYEQYKDPETFKWELNEIKTYDINDKDVIGITESLVARSQGNYITVDDIVSWINERYGNVKNIWVLNPIYSRNRFSMILKAFARAASERVCITMPAYDEVGNPSGVNKFTGVDIEKYYFDIIGNEGKIASFFKTGFRNVGLPFDKEDSLIVYCGLHDYTAVKEEFCPYDNFITLADIFNDKCEYGLLGSNKATEEKLKLFPNSSEAQTLIENIQKDIFEKTGKTVEVMVYGDGCFKDPLGGIWEFADPVVSPVYTKGLEGRPNEIKIKAFADDKFSDLTGDELRHAIKEEIKSKESNLVGNMASQGTTPRRYVDLLGSLMDLTSGSGDKGTPVVLVKNYFNNYSND